MLFLNLVIHNITINCGKDSNKSIYKETISKKNNNDEVVENNIGYDTKTYATLHATRINNTWYQGTNRP